MTTPEPRRTHLTLGIEGTYLPWDRRGMGRYLRNVLKRWEDVAHRLLLLARSRRHLEAMRAECPSLECAAAEDAPPIDACWFPWNRMDWDPGCPSVVTIHDVACLAGPFGGDRPDEDDRRRLRRSAARATRVITVSQFSRSEIVRHLGVPEDRIDVVPEGVDPVFHPEPQTPREEFLEKRTGGCPYLLYVGNEEPRKNLSGLLEAFRLLRLRFPRHALVLSGHPPEPRGLLRRFLGPQDPARDDRILYARRPDDATLAEYYRHADVFVMPSLYEGFGLPLLEAMACGTPVAAARAASLPELGGDVPTWFDPLDPADLARALEAALRDPQRGAGVGQAGLFRWSTAAARILEILESTARAVSV